MILKITKYGLAAHLGILAASPVALYPFLAAGALGRAILWFSLVGLIWILCEPSFRMGERSSDARARNLSEILRDPFLYFFIVAAAFALIRWCNNGISMAYDVESASWIVKEAAAPILPASAGDAGYMPFVATVAIGVMVLGVRHALGKSARLFCGLAAASAAGAGGLAAVAACSLGFAPHLVPAASAGFAASPYCGTAYGFFLILSIVCGMEAESRKWGQSRLPFVVAVAGNASALVFFAPPFAFLPFAVVSILVLIVSAVYCARSGTMGGCARGLAFSLLGFAAPVLLMMSLASSELQQAKLDGFDPENIPAEYFAARETLGRISKEIWMARPWSGAGTGAFGLNAAFVATKADWTVLPPHPADAGSGYWTLLAERGISGCFLIALGLALFVWAWIERLAGAVAVLRTNDESDVFFFACPPVVWIAPLLVALAAAELYFSNAFASIASVTAFAFTVALASASFPRKSAAPSGGAEKPV